MRVRPVLPPDRDPGRYAPGRGSRTRHGAALAGSLLLNLLLLAGVVAAMRGPDFLPSGNHPALVSISITPKPQKTAPPPPPSKAPPVDKPSLAPTRPAPQDNPAPLPTAPRGAPPASTAATTLPEPKPALLPAAAPTTAPPPPSRPAPDADRLDAYRQELWHRILAARPRRASGTGTVTIRFRIDRKGALVTSEIAGSSGQFLLDRLALQAVRKAAPFPAPPAEMEDAGLIFTVPVAFHG
ncbi:MAG: energy transducer TonB [Novosphingobium sp.]